MPIFVHEHQVKNVAIWENMAYYKVRITFQLVKLSCYYHNLIITIVKEYRMKREYLLNRRNQPIKMISAVIMVLLLNILTMFHPHIVYANGPMPASNLVVEVINFPDQAVYVDLLIRMDLSDQHYVAFNESIGKTYGIKRESEIVSYHEDGYLSYSFHFSNASCELALEKDKINVFADDYDDFNYIYDELRYFKVAILDSNGSIIAMSKEYKLREISDTYLVDGVITYDVSQNVVTGIDNYEGIKGLIKNLSFIFIFFLIMWVAPLIITMAIETWIARIYKFKSIFKITFLNFVSNLSLSFYIILVQRVNINYVSAVISGEILVYVFEYLCLYKIYHKTISRRRIAQFTVVANTASLLLTLLFNRVIKYVIVQM